MDLTDRAAMHATYGPPATRTVAVELCCTSLDEARAAERGGASRIELCASLEVDGLTPPTALVAEVRHHLAIPVFVLVRPRAGGHTWDAAELDVMRRSILRCRTLGADGIVTGALTPEGDVDEEAMQLLLEAARPLPVTFHRAIDAARAPLEAVEVLLSLGCHRVLSSGGARTAREGATTLAEMVRRAGEALTVVAGGRVRPDHAAALVRETGVREIHAHLGADAAVVERLVRSVG